MSILVGTKQCILKRQALKSSRKFEVPVAKGKNECDGPAVYKGQHEGYNILDARTIRDLIIQPLTSR